MKYQVEDMSCGHCTAAIEKAVAEAGGKAATYIDLIRHNIGALVGALATS